MESRRNHYTSTVQWGTATAHHDPWTHPIDLETLELNHTIEQMTLTEIYKHFIHQQWNTHQLGLFVLLLWVSLTLSLFFFNWISPGCSASDSAPANMPDKAGMTQYLCSCSHARKEAVDFWIWLPQPQLLSPSGEWTRGRIINPSVSASLSLCTQPSK